jgi:hypothetical protein
MAGWVLAQSHSLSQTKTFFFFFLLLLLPPFEPLALLLRLPPMSTSTFHNPIYFLHHHRSREHELSVLSSTHASPASKPFYPPPQPRERGEQEPPCKKKNREDISQRKWGEKERGQGKKGIMDMEMVMNDKGVVFSKFDAVGALHNCMFALHFFYERK